MKIRCLLLFLGAALLAGCSDDSAISADSQAAANDAQSLLTLGGNDGEALFFACQGCHGVKGEGNPALKAPSLVHQDSWYLKRQLMAFREGRRGNNSGDAIGQQMASIAATIPDEAAVEALVAYIDTLPDKVAKPTIKGDLAKGEDFYTMVCGSCHGPKAEGNKLLDAPALAGVDDWYLQRQFELFREGVRGAEDRYGRQMVMMASALSTDEDVNNVLAYIHSLAD